MADFLSFNHRFIDLCWQKIWLSYGPVKREANELRAIVLTINVDNSNNLKETNQQQRESDSCVEHGNKMVVIEMAVFAADAALMVVVLETVVDVVVVSITIMVAVVIAVLEVSCCCCCACSCDSDSCCCCPNGDIDSFAVFVFLLFFVCVFLLL